MKQTEPGRKKGGKRGWCRWLLWGVAGCGMLMAGVLLYLNWSGLPGWAQDSLVRWLRERGIEAEWRDARMQGWRRVALEGVQLRWAGAPESSGPAFGEANELLMEWHPLRGRGVQWQNSSVQLREVALHWRMPGSEGAPLVLSLDQVELTAALDGSGTLHLQLANGFYQGLAVSGNVTVQNVAAVRDWSFPRRDEEVRRYDWGRLRSLLEDLRFSEGSTLQLQVRGDGRAPESFGGKLRGRIGMGQADWGYVEEVDLVVESHGSRSGSGTVEEEKEKRDVLVEVGVGRLAAGEMVLHGVDVKGAVGWEVIGSRWGLAWTDLGLELERADWRGGGVVGCGFKVESRPAGGEGLLRTEVNGSARGGRWMGQVCGGVELAASLKHSLRRWGGGSGEGKLKVGQVRGDWGGVESTELEGVIETLEVGELSEEELDEMSWWSHLLPVRVEGDWRAREVTARGVRMEEVNAAIRWSDRVLEVPRLRGLLDKESFEGRVQLHVPTRRLEAALSSGFDPHRVEPLLTEKSRRWLRQFGWRNPPEVAAELSLVLPAWDESKPNWRRDVRPTVTMAGKFDCSSGGTFRGVPASGASGRFTMTNEFWTVSELRVKRPEGDVLLDYEWYMPTQEYLWTVRSEADVRVLRPLLEPAGQKILDQIEFEHPPIIQGEIRGKWHHLDLIAFKGEVAATNVTFRGEFADELRGAVSYTNQVLEIRDAFVRQGAGTGVVPAARLDLRNGLLHLTNAFSTLPPRTVTKVIGPKTDRVMQNYRCEGYPRVKVDGAIPIHQDAAANVRFEVEADGFAWWRLRVPAISGVVTWEGDGLFFSKVEAPFYSGHLSWNGQFDLSAPRGSEISFSGTIDGVDLRLLLRDAAEVTNRLEGVFSAEFAVEKGASSNLSSWVGVGRVNLKNGFLWELPIFGFISPVLNTVVPGLGKTRFSEGVGHVRLEEGRFVTEDLVMRSPALRMNYDGYVDLEGNVDSRVEAEIFRDAWILGKILSTVLWPVSKVFEYRITGTLGEPRGEPVYIPEPLVYVLTPVETLKRVLGAGLGNEKQDDKAEGDAVPAEAGKGVGLDEPQ